MPRDLDSSSTAALTSDLIRPAFFAELTFKSRTCYCWTGPGSYEWNGNTFLGLGSMVEISGQSEGVEIQANGITLTFSGFDSVLFGESMSDVQLCAPATVWFALLDGNMNIIGSPSVFFGGIVDKPTGRVGTDKCDTNGFAPDGSRQDNFEYARCAFR
ncbi:MAG: hypothetical protein WA419_12645 [Silvibacterium sp.]